MQKIKFKYREITETTFTFTQEEVCRIENYMRNNPSMTISETIIILIINGVISYPGARVTPKIYINEIDVDGRRVLSSDDFVDTTHWGDSDE